MQLGGGGGSMNIRKQLETLTFNSATKNAFHTKHDVFHRVLKGYLGDFHARVLVCGRAFDRKPACRRLQCTEVTINSCNRVKLSSKTQC